jgi:hypothetical protein
MSKKKRTPKTSAKASTSTLVSAKVKREKSDIQLLASKLNKLERMKTRTGTMSVDAATKIVEKKMKPRWDKYNAFVRDHGATVEERRAKYLERREAALARAAKYELLAENAGVMIGNRLTKIHDAQEKAIARLTKKPSKKQIEALEAEIQELAKKCNIGG